MSTLAEIQAALPNLSREEMAALERRLHDLRLSQNAAPELFTGSDAVRWWAEIEHLPPDEAEAFARDVEVAREAMNRPALAPRWA